MLIFCQIGYWSDSISKNECKAFETALTEHLLFESVNDRSYVYFTSYQQFERSFSRQTATYVFFACLHMARDGPNWFSKASNPIVTLSMPFHCMATFCFLPAFKFSSLKISPPCRGKFQPSCREVSSAFNFPFGNVLFGWYFPLLRI